MAKKKIAKTKKKAANVGFAVSKAQLDAVEKILGTGHFALFAQNPKNFDECVDGDCIVRGLPPYSAFKIGMGFCELAQEKDPRILPHELAAKIARLTAPAGKRK